MAPPIKTSRLGERMGKAARDVCDAASNWLKVRGKHHTLEQAAEDRLTVATVAWETLLAEKKPPPRLRLVPPPKE